MDKQPYSAPEQVQLLPQQYGGVPMRTMQPGVMQSIPLPPGVPNCPSGLEYLTMVDSLVVRQKLHLLEAFTGYEQANKYLVTNALGQQAYYAVEKSDWMQRQCCGPMREFDMEIWDNFQSQVMHIHRPLRCRCCCCGPWGLQELEVRDRAGALLGFVMEDWWCWRPRYRIENANHETVLRIVGPHCCLCKCCKDVNFKVLTPDGVTQVGNIAKKWSGMAQELYTDADTFGVQFPMDLDVTVKATLLAATFLIDFMFFEDNQQKK